MSEPAQPDRVWTCAACLARQPFDAARCTSCGRSRSEEAFRRAVKRAVAIVFGLAVQLVCGVLVWLHPPGTPLAWVMYLAAGAIGAAHVVAGAFLWRQRSLTDGDRGPVAAFVPGDLPYHLKQCSACGSDLAAAIAGGRRRCPACRMHFRLADFGWMRDDPAGEPRTLPQRERRMDGRLLAAVFGALLLLILAGLHLLTVASGPAPGGP